MKKKYLVGSILVVLSMLVSTQLVFMKTAKSDPTIHYGDAEVGEFWITELDVSAALEEVNYIGVAHARASDDWVCWDEGTGNVTAEWEVNITSEQNPEYVVSYVFGVFNVDADNKCIGSDEFNMTCSAQTGYSSGGTLQVSIEFSPEEMEQGSVTLVCLLDTTVCINDTEEAKNFMSVSQDRCVIGVDFEWPQSEPPFSGYRDEANEEMPGMWFWLPSWESRFSSENQMMDEQTVLIGGFGEEYTGSSQVNPQWDIGDISVDYTEFHNPIIDITADADHVDWYRNNANVARGLVKVDYDIDTWPNILPVPRPIFMNWVLKQSSGGQPYLVGCGSFIWFRVTEYNILGEGTVTRLVRVNAPGTGPIYMSFAKIRVICFDLLALGQAYMELDLSNDIYVNIVGTQSDTFAESESWNWNGYCANQNISTTYENGIVKGNIASLLQTDDNMVYTYAGDRGETTIEMFCEQ